MNGMFYEKGVNPFEATPSAFATNPMGMAQILLFIGLTEGYTFPEGAWSGDMKRDPCLLYTSPSPRDRQKTRMPSSA